MQRLWWLLLASLPACLAGAQGGGELFEKNCAGCHKEGSPTGAPLPQSLRQMSRQAIMESLLTGKMLVQAASLSLPEREAIAEYLAPKEPELSGAGRCEAGAGLLQDARGWQGWSADAANSRFQNVAAAGLDAGKVGK